MACANAANNPPVIVKAISHTSETIDRGSHTYCAPAGTAVNCTNRNLIMIVVNQVVELDGMKYTLECRAKWIWNTCLTLDDGETFPAQIKGKTMIVEGHYKGNQGKIIHEKFQILDIR